MLIDLVKVNLHIGLVPARCARVSLGRALVGVGAMIWLECRVNVALGWRVVSSVLHVWRKLADWLHVGGGTITIHKWLAVQLGR